MADLGMLYQQIILDHSKNPRYFQENPDLPYDKVCYNPLCGDNIHVYCAHEEGVITALTFTGEGCAISMASASLMAEALQGLPIEQARLLFRWFIAMATAIDQEVPACPEYAKKLQILQGVRQFPMRVKCATCAWHAFIGALDNTAGSVKTE
jgi:nitrogen fixation NifU-like protein